MTRALVLDFGGVVTKTIFETHRETEIALGLAPGSLAWQGPFAPETDPLWVSMQSDEISERQYYAQRTLEVARLTGNDWTEMSQFIRAARGADPDSVIRPEALSAIDTAISQGHRLAILSNELDLFYGQQFRKKLPFLEHFDVIADATHTGILKPDARAYLDCCNRLKLEPQHCVFVDDQHRNIEGAIAVGMSPVHFDVTHPADSYRQALSALNQ